MLYVGGYPGIHNKTNISTLYTFVNGQKEYFWQNYNVINDKVINDKWDWDETKTRCGDDYGIIGIGNDGHTYNNKVFYLPNRILDEAPSHIDYTSQTDQGSNVTYYPCGDGQAYYRAINPTVYYFWPDVRVNQPIKLHEYNSFFLEAYNSSNYNDYSVCWMKEGAILQKKIDDSSWEHYYMPYEDLTQCITLSDIDNSILIRVGDYSVDGVDINTPAGEIAYSMEHHKVIYMKGSKVLGVYDILNNDTGFYTTVCGRYAYTLKSRYVYCYDMITNEQVSYSGLNGNSSIGKKYISHYHPESGYIFYNSSNTRITKFDGMNEPTYINNPFGSYAVPYMCRFRDGKYRYVQLVKNSDTHKWAIKYLDESWVLHSYDSNLSYSDNNTSSSIISSKYGCWIFNVNIRTEGVTTGYFYYSWDNGATWNLIP